MITEIRNLLIKRGFMCQPLKEEAHMKSFKPTNDVTISVLTMTPNSIQMARLMDGEILVSQFHNSTPGIPPTKAEFEEFADMLQKIILDPDSIEYQDGSEILDRMTESLDHLNKAASKAENN